MTENGEIMIIENIDIQQIVPYTNNPRINDASVPKVKLSIQQFGFRVPIIIDANNIIICGHTRYKAALELGINEIPCIRADDLSDEQIKAFRIADNKAGEDSSWDYEKLLSELEGIKELDMSEYGFDFDDGEELHVQEDDFDEEQIPEEPTSKYGQIYELGNHRLMCGDSTKESDVLALMNGNLADLVVTDPPYNVNVSNSKGLKIENDNLEEGKFRDFLEKAFDNMCKNMRKGGCFYVWLASKEWIAFEEALNKSGLYVRQELIWNKNTFTLGRQDYQWKHEPCMYGWKDGAAHFFIDDRTQASVFEDEQSINFNTMKKHELVELLEKVYSDKISTTIINENKPAINDLHPTMKPLKLIERLIKNSSRSGEIVLDLFGGSGSTLMTCEQLNRKCYTVEYDPRYVDAIINRWEQFTGKKAKLINK